MIDRISPFLALLLSELVMGFVPLFCLAFSTETALPSLWPVLAALAIWSIPDLVVLGRAARSDARMGRLFHAVVASLRWGGLGLLGGLLIFLTIHALLPAFSLFMAGVAAYLLGSLLQSRELRRQVKRLYVLDPEGVGNHG